MTTSERKRRQENFEMWITFIPDKVSELKQNLPTDISNALDLSTDSLDVIEGYLIDNYSLEYFKNEENKFILDRFASYIGSAFKKNLPLSYWDIELKDTSDVFFGRPVVKIKERSLPPISPYNLIFTVLIRKQRNLLKSLMEKSIQKIFNSC